MRVVKIIFKLTLYLFFLCFVIYLPIIHIVPKALTQIINSYKIQSDLKVAEGKIVGELKDWCVDSWGFAKNDCYAPIIEFKSEDGNLISFIGEARESKFTIGLTKKILYYAKNPNIAIDSSIKWVRIDGFVECIMGALFFIISILFPIEEFLRSKN